MKVEVMTSTKSHHTIHQVIKYGVCIRILSIRYYFHHIQMYEHTFHIWEAMFKFAKCHGSLAEERDLKYITWNFVTTGLLVVEKYTYMYIYIYITNTNRTVQKTQVYIANIFVIIKNATQTSAHSLLCTASNVKYRLGVQNICHNLAFLRIIKCHAICQLHKYLHRWHDSCPETE